MEIFLVKLGRKHTSGEMETPLVSKLATGLSRDSSTQAACRKQTPNKRNVWLLVIVVHKGEMQSHKQLYAVCGILHYRNVTRGLLYIGLYLPACSQCK
jgi:hypothetical protein